MCLVGTMIVQLKKRRSSQSSVLCVLYQNIQITFSKSFNLFFFRYTYELGVFLHITYKDAFWGKVRLEQEPKEIRKISGKDHFRKWETKFTIPKAEAGSVPV